MKKIFVSIIMFMLVFSGCNVNRESEDIIVNDFSYTVYKSELYNFELSYPADYNIFPVGMENLSYGSEIFGIGIFNANRALFSISIIYTPDFSTLGPVNKEAVRPFFEEKNIRKIADMAYVINEEDHGTKIIDSVKKINVGGQDGYQFILDKSETYGFTENAGGRVLDEPERIVYVSDGINLYKITLIADSSFAEEILESLKFLAQ